MSENIDYGPLSELIGIWKGKQGVDIAPEPGGTENNAYYDTIIYSAIGDVSNAETQTLTALHYRQIVKRQSNDEIFHDETGYWMWDAKESIIMHSLLIPRAVGVLAGGLYTEAKDSEGRVILEVAAGIDNKDWQIMQSPFMQKNVRTTEFKQTIIVGNGKLSFSQTTMLDIYGKVFEHTDDNELTLQ